MHLRILPDHQKLFFKKDIFDRLEWLKTCFDAFSHTSRSPETFFLKRYFLLSEVVPKVFLCICAYFPITRNFFQKRYFLLSGVVKNVFFIHLRILPDHQKLFFRKDIFDRQEWLKTCFDAFAHTFGPPETFCQKRYFLPSRVVKSVF